jgi:DNA polymerase (family 10)
MENKDVAKVFNEIADALEITGGDQFKIRAYRKAAMNIEDLSRRLEDIYNENKKDLTEVPGVGKSIAKKIEELFKKGEVKKHKRLLKKVSPELLELTQVTGIGPKHLKILMDELNVKNAKDLEKVCRQHKARELEGFGEKTEKKILEALKEYRRSEGRIKLEQAFSYAESLSDYLKKGKDRIDKLEIAGSLRRGVETIGDIDILVSARSTLKVMDKFTKYPEIKEVLSKGKSKSSVVLKSGLRVDLENVKKNEFGSSLIYFTGSKAHNIHIRKIAKSKGYKINEYGVFKGKRNLASKTEEDVYKVIGLKYIEPELREDRGEIEAAKKDKLPKVIKLSDIKGDLHMHTKKTDGAHSIRQMAEVAKERGYDYIAITEHSKSVRIAGGIDEKELAKHIKDIEKEDKKIKGIHILKGIEVDIKESGKLDLEDNILKELDIVIAAVHFKFNLNEEEMTERILKAFDNKHVNVLAHPTGRLIGKRSPYSLNFEKVFKEAKKRNIALELNSNSNRLDLNDVHCKLAKDIGAKIIINTDSHAMQQLHNIEYGVITARRGWLEKKDVFNTLNYETFIKKIKRF